MTKKKEIPRDIPICQRCGEQHVTKDGREACPGHITQGDRRGKPCRHETGWGTDGHAGEPGVVCIKHGGATRNHRKHAAMQQLETEVRRQLDLTEWEPVTDPFTALANIAGEMVAVKDIMRAKVEELETLRQYGGEFGEQIDIMFAAYERFLDRTEKTLASMARLDLDARIAKLQAAIDAETARIVQRALNGALKAEGLPQDQRNTIMRNFGRELRVKDAATNPPALED